MRKAVLSLLGVGFVPGPSGTYASLVTTIALLALHGPALGLASSGLWVAFGFGVLATILLAGREAQRGGHADPGYVVTDEVAGQAVALGLAGAVAAGNGYVAAGLAFVLFRVFDILKPGPIGWAERLPGGVGVLADDLLAGVAAGGLVLAARAVGALG